MGERHDGGAMLDTLLALEAATARAERAERERDEARREAERYRHLYEQTGADGEDFPWERGNDE